MRQPNNRLALFVLGERGGIVGALIRKIRRPNARALARGVYFITTIPLKITFSETTNFIQYIYLMYLFYFNLFFYLYYVLIFCLISIYIKI